MSNYKPEESQMRFLFPLGRLLYALIFIVAGPRHFTHGVIEDAAKHGVPFADFSVPLSGVVALAGGISIAIGYKARWGARLLIAFLLLVTPWLHAFWTVSDPVAAHIETVFFFKNVSMLGAAILISQFGAGPVSIDDAKTQH